MNKKTIIFIGILLLTTLPIANASFGDNCQGGIEVGNGSCINNDNTIYIKKLK